MKRTLSAVLISVTVMAIAAFAASTAPAQFHKETAHTIFDGEQPQYAEGALTVKAGTLRCKSVTYSGTSTSATSSSIRLTPAFKECTAFGFVSTPVSSSNCHWEITTTATNFHMTATWEYCVKVESFSCWITIGSQTISGLTADNAGSGSSRDVTLTINASGITYTQQSKSFPGCSNGTFSDGKLVSSATVRGFNTAGGQVGIWAT